MIKYNGQYELWCPGFEPRLLQKDWFKKTFNNIERELATMINLTRGSREKVCIQAGGHIGIYPIYLSTHFDTVYTFEPDPITFQCLDKNKGLRNIKAVNAGLSNFNEGKKFYRSGKSGGGTFFPDFEAGVEFEEFTVAVMRIDDLCLNTCDAIFLDIEWGERQALEGAKETIAAHKPFIQVEVHKDSKERIDDILTEYGYKYLTKAGSRDEVYVPI